jgi:hypothetical protein
MKNINLKMVLGLFTIGFGVFLQVLWLIFCFSTILVGILLLLFAPAILFFPFNFFFALGLSIIGKEFTKNSNSKYYRYNFRYKNYNHSHNNNYQRYHYEAPSDNIDSYYKILNSNKTDSFETIKKNYRNLIKKYHYDTIASKGLSEKELKEAEEMTKKINEAYSKIKEIHKR